MANITGDAEEAYWTVDSPWLEITGQLPRPPTRDKTGTCPRGKPGVSLTQGTPGLTQLRAASP
jgi:hypothetical protein